MKFHEKINQEDKHKRVQSNNIIKRKKLKNRNTWMKTQGPINNAKEV